MKRNQKQLISAIVAIVVIVLTALGILPQVERADSYSGEAIAGSNQTTADFSQFEKERRYPLSVDRVIDGDTFHVTSQGQSFKVRLLLVDTPETDKQGKAAQPFAEEAKKRTQALLQHASVIEGQFDVGDKTDKYGRALMYVYLDGKLLQSQLVEEGLARVGYAYPPNTSLLKELQRVEATAKTKKQNIWEKDGYVTKKGFNPEVY